MKVPKVFISYSHDSDEHAKRVRDLSGRLRNQGVDCIIDQYDPFPPAGWPLWMTDHIDNDDFVLIVCTKTYYCRAMNKEVQGKGRGVKWEVNLIYS